jgi:SRSO17 transposase
MILSIPQSINLFCQLFKENMTKWQKQIIPRMMTGMLMACGDPNFAVISRSIVTQQRNRSSVMRFFKTKRFKSRDLYRQALRQVIKCLKHVDKDLWFIILDGTSSKRGGFTKILNAIKYKKKSSSEKGKSTKAHMFLMGLLLLPNGMRLPLPRMSYYTKEYCKKTGKKFVTIVKLAVEMIKQAPIPAKVKKVMVLADEYFEGQMVHEICNQLGYKYIMPIDSRRCFSDRYGKSTSITLHERGRHLASSLFQKVQFVTGNEETASYRRLSAKTNRKYRRVYRAYTEIRSVTGLGDVSITYSWKQQKKGSRKCGETYKVFVSNDKKLSVGKIIEYYELRWQIELFFREIKSELGFSQYCGGDFQSFERYIDILLLGFLFLEQHRINLKDSAISQKEKGKISRSRTKDLLRHLQKEINIENAKFLDSCLKKRKRRKNLAKIIEGLLKAA